MRNTILGNTPGDLLDHAFGTSYPNNRSKYSSSRPLLREVAREAAGNFGPSVPREFCGTSHAVVFAPRNV